MPESEFATASISLSDIARRLGLSGFGAWWLDELTSVVPERLRIALERRRLRPVIAFDGDRIAFWRPSQRDEALGMREASSIAAGTDAATLAAQGRASLDAIFVATPGNRDVTLALGSKQVLRRRLKLPAAVEDDLRATIGFDIDRLTPFKSEDLHFDVVVVDRDPSKREISVDVVTVRRRVVDQAVALAHSFGANVVAIVADPPRDAAQSRINLLTPEDRVDGSRYLRWQFLLPLLLLLALIAAVAIVPLWHKRNDAIAMMNAADQAAIRAQQSDRLRSELDRMVREYNFALERKYATPGVAQVLDEVTRLLPDDTWVTQLEIKSSIRGKATQRELFIRGESANAGKLISLLENATLVGDAVPRSPTTKLQPGPGESFDIGAHVKSATMPKKIALTESVRSVLRPPIPAAAAPVPPATQAAPAPEVSAAAPTRGTGDATAAAKATPAAAQAAAASADADSAAPASRARTRHRAAGAGRGAQSDRRDAHQRAKPEANAPDDAPDHVDAPSDDETDAEEAQ